MCHSHLGLAAWSRVGAGSLALCHLVRLGKGTGCLSALDVAVHSFAVARLAAAVPKQKIARSSEVCGYRLGILELHPITLEFALGSSVETGSLPFTICIYIYMVIIGFESTNITNIPYHHGTV